MGGILDGEKEIKSKCNNRHRRPSAFKSNWRYGKN